MEKETQFKLIIINTVDIFFIEQNNMNNGIVVPTSFHVTVCVCERKCKHHVEKTLSSSEAALAGAVLTEHQCN